MLAPAERILLELADVPPSQRMAWIARRCQGNPALFAGVQALVEQMEAPDDARVEPASGGERWLAPGTVVDDFTICQVLGAGAAGVAYIARQESPPRDVALKVLRGRCGPDAARRFELEAEVLARLDHPGIARVFASRAAHDTTPAYIAMELVDGIPATEFAVTHDLPVTDCLTLVARICDAVHHAHQRGVIHRDLKPANILVTADGQPRVLDFGVARLVGGAARLAGDTQVGQLVGTLPYTSPEQVAGDPADLDIRTDVYALGVLLYHLLARTLPFDFSERNLTDAVRAICQGDVVRLTERRPDIGRDIVAIVRRAMARSRDRRYESAAALAEDLRRAAEGLPIAAHRDSAWVGLREGLRRSRLVATAAAVGLIGVAALAGYARVQKTEARDAATALSRQLALATVERGRLLARMGNMPVAESLLWQQDEISPGDATVLWALRELYARYPSAWETPAHPQDVQVVRFSPDDRHVLSGGRDGSVRLMSARDGASVFFWTDHAPAGVATVGFASSGSVVYSTGHDGRVVTRDVASGTLKTDWRLDAGRLESTDLLVDGTLVLTTTRRRDGEVEGGVWTASLTAGSPRRVWTAHGRSVLGVAPAPAGREVAVGTSDGQLTVLDLQTGVVRWQRPGHERETARVAWSPDGQWLATGGTDRTVRIWNAVTGELQQTLSTGNGTTRSVAFSPDSRRVVAAGWWRVDVWDVGTGQLLRDDIGASQGWYDARFSASGEQLVIGAAGGSVRLWELADTFVLSQALPSAPLSVSFDIDRAALHPVIGRSDGRIAAFRPGGPPFAVRHGARLTALATDATGRQFVSAGADPLLRAWRHGGNGVVPQATVQEGDALSVALSRDGRLAAVGEVGGRLTVVSPEDGRVVLTVGGEGSDLLAVRFDAAGTRIFTAYRDNRIVIRDLSDGQALSTLHGSSPPFVLAFHEETGRLAAGTWTGAIDVWDVATGRTVAQLTGHARLVTDLDFLSPDTLCSTGHDGTVRVWSIGHPSELALLRQRTVGGEGIRAVDDGQRLAVLFEDGLAELIDLARLDARIAGHR